MNESKQSQNSTVDQLRAQMDAKYGGGADIGEDRYVYRIPIGDLEEHPQLKQVRGESPSDISLMRDSYDRTGGPIYPLLVFIAVSLEDLKVYLVDGHQRFRSAKEKGLTHVPVIWNARSLTPKAAMEDAMTLQNARYEMTEVDLISVLRTGVLTVAEVAALGGKSESSVRRLKTVADHAWLEPLFIDKAISAGMAKRLVEKADGDSVKLEALKATLLPKYDAAVKHATMWRNKIKAESGKKWDRKTRDKAKVATYFKSEPWSAYEQAIELGDFADDVGVRKLDIGTAPTAAPVRIGDDADWENDFAVYSFFGAKHEDVLLADMKEVLDDWDGIGSRIKAIYKRRRYVEGVASIPIPSPNPPAEFEAPPMPAPQKDDLDIEDMVEEVTDDEE